MASSQQESPYLQFIGELLLDARDAVNAGRYAAAEEKYRRVVPLQQRVDGPEHAATLASHIMHACTLMALERYSEAEPMLRDIVQIQQQSSQFGFEHRETLLSVTTLGECLTRQGRWKEAEPMLRSAYGTHVRVHGPHDELTSSAQSCLGSCLVHGNQVEEAEGLLWDVCKQYSTEHPKRLPSAMTSYAECLIKADKDAEAEPVLREAVKLAQCAHGEHDQVTLDAMELHGGVLETLGRHAEAEDVYRLALQGSQGAYGCTDERTLMVVGLLAGCLKAQGKVQAMQALLDENYIHMDAVWGKARRRQE